MKHTLYLTAEERDALFGKLPVALQKKWFSQMKEETIDAYESREELLRRTEEVQRKPTHASGAFAKQLEEYMNDDDGLTKLVSSDVPQSVLADGFYQLGATGLSALLQLALQEETMTQDDMEAAASLSMIRHQLLETNVAAA